MTMHIKRDHLSIIAGVAVMVLVVAACTIKLRDDEQQAASASPASQDPNPLATELARCRYVTPEQKDQLEACRRVWAEQRRQFLGQSKTRSAISNPDNGAPNVGLSASGQHKDQNRLPQGWPSNPREGE